MQTVPALPRVLPWNSAPEDMAARLRVLPGLVWLDTAGHRPEPDSDGGLSLLTASPRQILTGHLSDPAPLEQALAQLRQRASSQADWGFPTSGLFGTVTAVEGDKVGSRLWLLGRSKRTADTLSRLEEYAREALRDCLQRVS